MGNNAKRKFLIVSGPDLNLPGSRQTSIYAQESLDDIHRSLDARADELGVEVECHKFNSEGELIDCLQDAPKSFEGVVINGGALAHNSLALRSALEAMLIPCVEVYISNPHDGEELRHKSVIAPICVGVIGGFGKKSYLLGLEAVENCCTVRDRED